MDKYIKIQANQSLFSHTANLVDFVIPQGDVYDLSDSWMNMNFVTNVVEVAAEAQGGIYNSDLEWIPNVTAGKHPKFFNSAIVRDATMESSRHGILESLQRVDILSQAKATYDKSWGEALSESYKAGCQMIQPINHQVYGIENQINKVGTNKSVSNLNNQVMVRLGDVMDICNTTEYDTMRAGQTRVHFRLNLDKLRPVQKMLSTAAEPIAEVKQFRDVTTGTVGNTIILGGTGAGAVDMQVHHLDEVPYFVGMKVGLAWEFGPVAAPVAATGTAVISAIVWDKENKGRYTLSFETDWASVPPTATDTYTKIVVTPASPWDSAELLLASCQLVLKRKIDPAGATSIDYTTYSTEQGNGNRQTTFNQVFPTEGAATNLLMCFQDGDTQLISHNVNVLGHQLSVNNVPLTDRLVSSDSPLDYDRKVATFRRLGSKLSNLVENAGAASSLLYGSAYTELEFKSTVIAAPLPVTAQQKQLSVHIECGNGNVGGFEGVGQYALFKSLPRSLVY